MPGDASIKGIKRLLQFTGIGFGAALGQPLLVNACVKSLVHDVLVEVVSKGIGDFLRNTLEPAGTRERDLEDPEVSSESSGRSRN